MPEVELPNPNADWRPNPVTRTDFDVAKCSACGADIPCGFALGIHVDVTETDGEVEPTYMIEFAPDQRNHLEGENI